jgi:hypothetical protein
VVLINVRYSYFKSRHSAWKNGCDTLTVLGLHENWTLTFRFQVSAQPPAKKTTGLIEKEIDEVSYKQLRNFK